MTTPAKSHRDNESVRRLPRHRYGFVATKLSGLVRELRHQNPRQFEATYEEVAAGDTGLTALGRVFLAHRGRYIFKWTHYIPAYDEQFGPFRKGFPLPDGSFRPLRMLEIGVLHGGSLQLWREFFGPDAVIYGIDINPDVAAVDDPDLEVRIGSQDDPDFLRKVVSEMGGVDIVLDDGSHIAKHQRVSFETLFPLLSDGGIYAVEDLHTSYWYNFGGRHGHGKSFIELTKALVDDMHAWYHSKGESLPVSASRNIPKITIYDSIAFIQKARHGRPSSVRFGEQAY
jgi:Methyltransferase domain